MQNFQKQIELEIKLKEQNILKAELETLKSHKKVYVQQPNSYVFFKSDIKSCLSDCKKSITQLERENTHKVKSK